MTKLTFWKASGFEAARDWYPEPLARLEVEIKGPVRLSYGSLQVTVDQQVGAIGGALYRAGDEIAEYQGFDQVWTLAGGTKWSDIEIEP